MPHTAGGEAEQIHGVVTVLATGRSTAGFLYRLLVDTSGRLLIDIIDSALRDLGKVDVASLDQYTPQTVGGLSALPVMESPRGTVLSGQAPVTTAAAALASNACKRVRVRAFAQNPHVVYIGPTGVTRENGFPLWPGDHVDLLVNNTNLISHIAIDAGASVAFLAEA